MQRKRNQLLLVALVLVSMAIVTLELTKGNTTSSNIEKKIFQLDPQQEITDVYLDGPEQNIHFRFTDGRWTLNDSLLLDQSMRDVFFSVVSQVEVRRPVQQSVADSIEQIIKTRGTHVKISFGQEVIKDYWVAGNREEELSWMMTEGDAPYQVHLPGYQSFVAGIFEVPTKDWRSRFLATVNFALVQNIKMEYPGKSTVLELVFQDNFYAIPGVNADSSKIANFLDQIAYLQADEFIKRDAYGGRYVALIDNDAVYSILSFKLLNGQSEEIRFYETVGNDQFRLARSADGSYCLIDKRRIAGLFKTSTDFD